MTTPKGIFRSFKFRFFKTGTLIPNIPGTFNAKVLLGDQVNYGRIYYRGHIALRTCALEIAEQTEV